VEQFALGDAVFLFHAADLENFAAQPDHHHPGDIGIARIAPLRALEDVESLAFRGHATAGAVNQCDDAIDIGIVREQTRSLDLFGDKARHRRGTIHAGQNAQIVAGSRLAIGAAIAFESRLFAFGENCLRLGPFAEMIVAGKFVHDDIVLMHPFADFDRLRGKADDLAEFGDRRPGMDVRCRHFVPLRHTLARRGFSRGNIARSNFVHGDNDIVVFVEAQCARDGHCQLI
jgi:hypothetical protein